MSSITIASIPRLTRETLSTWVLNQIPSRSHDFAIIDVRDSDHIGGHIRGSVHVPSSTLDYRIPELVRQLQDKDAVVFHCSLSQQRGPSAALRYARERERLLGLGLELNDRDVGGKDGAGEGERPAGAGQRIFILDGGFVGWQQRSATGFPSGRMHKG
jgi:rhodanese-related sulfurtransferase